MEQELGEIPGGARWYAVRTRSRHEKVVKEQLDGRGVEAFLPLWERLSRWKDRKKKIQTPLFPGYCFARFEWGDRLLVLKAFGVAGLVGINQKAEPIPDVEIDAIRTLVATTLRYDPHPYLAEGMEVEVVRGPMMGVKGRLIRKDRAARLVLSVNLIRKSVTVEIDADDVVPF